MRAAGNVVCLRVRVTVKPIYHCADCKMIGIGDQVELEGLSMEEAMATDISNQNMPVGWGSYWGEKRSVFRCPTCKLAYGL